jgi:excisionase family DNA binding protein
MDIKDYLPYFTIATKLLQRLYSNQDIDVGTRQSAVVLSLGVFLKRFDDYEDINNKPLSVAEAAEYLHISETFLYKLVQRKKIKCYKPHKRLYFFRRDLIVYASSKIQ